jgi:hypothetical protein
MKKTSLAAFLLFLLILTACSLQPQASSIPEVLKAEGVTLSEIDPTQDNELDGVKPRRFKLDNEEMIHVYSFSSAEKQKLGFKQFQEHQQLLSSHAPIVYQANPYLILYYNNADSKTQTAQISETKYGEKIQRAINQIK